MPKTVPPDSADLRRRAESLALSREQRKVSFPRDVAGYAELVHELRVHQIELELQNEELRRSQVALAASRNRFFDLYNLAPLGYLTISETGLILEANLAASSLVGVPRATLAKRRFSAFIHTEDQDKYYLARRRLFEGSGAGVESPAGLQTVELRVVPAEGEAFWAILDLALVTGQEAAPVAHVILRDNSDRRRSEDDQRRLAAILETQVEECTREIRTSHASLEKRTEQLRELASRLVMAEEEERKRLASVLHDDLQQLLVAAKLRVDVSGPREEIMELLDKAVAFSQSVAEDLSPPVIWDEGLSMGLEWLARRMSTDYGLDVTIEGGKSAEPSETLSIVIFRAVRELLFNVVKHAGVDKANVSVEVIELSSIRVTVSDDGCGFSVDGHEGFGLFSLRERLADVGGSFQVHSAPGDGARVILEVPVALGVESPDSKAVFDPGEGEGDPGAADDIRSGTCRVLIADDHGAFRNTLVGLLRADAGVEIVGEAENGEQAVQQAMALKPDVVIMDVSMPVMNGIEATRLLSRKMQRTKIVALSMHDTAEVGRAMKEAGASASITKTANVAEILATIREVRTVEPG